MPTPDEHFANPVLASIYDSMDPDRSDLDLYLDLLTRFGAQSVLDLGCGTGTFACMLAARGLDVVGVDPAAASIDVARSKPNAERVRWICGDASGLSGLGVDAATMTANVAQVFVDEDYWRSTLAAIHRSLRAGGRLVFEVRDPARRAWEGWNSGGRWARTEIDGVGIVETNLELTEVSLPLVSFRRTYRFARDGVALASDSTLRFRERDEIEAGLSATGFRVDEVLDAPDRPGLEFVFVCTALG